MSKHLLSFLLSELKTVRIHCKRPYKGGLCSGIAEVPLERLGSIGKCPLCHADFQSDLNHMQRFSDFAKAVANMLQESSVYDVEFVLSEDEQ